MKMESKKFLFRILWLSVCLFLLSLGIYDRDDTKSWGSVWVEGFQTDLNHVAVGLPCWLVYNQYTSTGNVPDIKTLSDTQRYPEGIHIDWLMLGVNVVICVFLGLALGYLSKNWPRQNKGLYVVTGLFSFLFSLWVVFGIYWGPGIGIFILYMYLMIVIGMFSKFLNIIRIAFLGSLLLWWFISVLAIFNDNGYIRNFDFFESILRVLIRTIILAFPAILSFSFSKLMKKLRLKRSHRCLKNLPSE